MPYLVQGNAGQLAQQPNTLDGEILSDQQIELVHFMFEKQYADDLVQQILANSAYYTAVAELIKLGLTQDIAAFFADPDKVKELEPLEKITDLSLKQLCLVFWVKGTLSNQEYQNIIKACETYPLLTNTLIALDKTGEVSIGELKAWALNPKKHLQRSIIHYFSAYFTVNKGTLNKLTANELDRLSQSFLILKTKKQVTADYYAVVARDNPQGELFRLFLPSFALESQEDYRDTLIDLVYEGVHKGPISLTKKVFAITDDKLRAKALKLNDRFICAKLMQKLGFINEIISFAADAKNDKANKLRYIILRVEAQCKKIHERLLGSNTALKQIQAWQSAEKNYRKTLYAIAYDAIQDPDVDFKLHLAPVQNQLLSIVDPEIKLWLHKALIIIANVCITALTFGLANEYKYQHTRNFWFFNHTTSGEELYALEHDFTDLFKSESEATLLGLS